MSNETIGRHRSFPRLRAAAALLTALAVSGVVLHAGARDDPAVCIRVWKETPYRNYGYDHVVAVANGCDQPLQCKVSTDVSPRQYTVTVPPERTARVLTFRGAPRRDFSAHVECRAAE